MRLPAIVALSLALCASAFHVVPRRAAVQAGLGVVAATLVLPLSPASAKTKAEILADMRRREEEAKASDKGLAKVDLKAFDKSDSVIKNRKENMGVARDASGNKIVKADRNPDPASLGLKQWDGS